MQMNINTFIGCEASYKEADIVIFGAPFDGTTSFRPGTRFAPSVMRIESYGLETFSPYLNLDLEDYSVYDGGDLDFPFGNPQKVMDQIYDYTKTVLNDGKIPFMIGGEHLVSYPTIKAAAEQYDDLVVLHFDAHADLRDDYMGEKLSHASVIRRAWDILGDDRIYQFCIRSGEREEFQWCKEHTTMERFTFKTLKEVCEKIKGKRVYLTIDLDVLDPSIFPGTGTIEPGGITFNEMMEIVSIMQDVNIVGADIVELSPHFDNSGTSTAVACKVLRELLLAILGGNR